MKPFPATAVSLRSGYELHMEAYVLSITFDYIRDPDTRERELDFLACDLENVLRERFPNTAKEHWRRCRETIYFFNEETFIYALKMLIPEALSAGKLFRKERIYEMPWIRRPRRKVEPGALKRILLAHTPETRPRAKESAAWRRRFCAMPSQYAKIDEVLGAMPL